MKKILMLVPMLMFLVGCGPKTDESTTAPADTNTPPAKTPAQ
ncbi:MAG: hypothetical protein U1G07_00950 [Verrucomicrobiota bacterium]